MLNKVQERVRPRLVRVDDREQILRALGPASAQLLPGTAVALLGSPGVDLKRMTNDVVRGVPEGTVIVWLDIADLRVNSLKSGEQGEVTLPGGVWDQALNALIQQGLEDALDANQIKREMLHSAVESAAEDDDPWVLMLQQFGHLCRKQRRWPVLSFHSMHRLPWAVSDRMQWRLRRALDNADRTPVLRLVLSGASDFLSGEAIADGAGYQTSPLFARTTRYEIVNYSTDQLMEFSPLPHGLPDRALEIVGKLTGGSIGVVEVMIRAMETDALFGKAVVEHCGANGEVPSWMGEWVSRSEGVGRELRLLIREGVAALLSSPKGRSWAVIDALQRIFDGQAVEEISSDELLPIEMAGFLRATRANGVFRYEFLSPMMQAGLYAVLPRGKSVREQLNLFQATFHWDELQPSEENTIEMKETTVRTTGAGARMHVVVHPRPADAEKPEIVEERSPLEFPAEVKRLMDDGSPAAVRGLLELLETLVHAVIQARAEGNRAILTFAQLKITYVSMEAVIGAEKRSNAELEKEGATLPAEGLAPGRWQVVMVAGDNDDASRLEAAAFFVPPERLAEWLKLRTLGKEYVLEAGDDAYAIGVVIGYLLAREANARLIPSKVEARCMVTDDIGVGVLLRTVRRCLDPHIQLRPSLEEVRAAIAETLQDPFGGTRRLLRYLLIISTILVVAIGAADWALDLTVDNPSMVYAAIKVVGAGIPTALYAIAYLVLGRSDKEQVNRQIINFLRQRMNRIRWMTGPTLLSLFFSVLFGHRLINYKDVLLTASDEHRITEVRLRSPDGQRCETAFRFAEPQDTAHIRLWLNHREYVFLAEAKDPTAQGSGAYIWDEADVDAHREGPWGNSLHIKSLPPAPVGDLCVPAASGARREKGTEG